MAYQRPGLGWRLAAIALIVASPFIAWFVFKQIYEHPAYALPLIVSLGIGMAIEAHFYIRGGIWGSFAGVIAGWGLSFWMTEIAKVGASWFLSTVLAILVSLLPLAIHLWIERDRTPPQSPGFVDKVAIVIKEIFTR